MLEFIGLDVGATQIKAMGFAADGRVLVREQLATGDNGSREWLERVRAILARIREKCSSSVRVGVAAPGLPARDARSIACMPDRLPGLEGLDWQKWLGLEKPVPVFNDAHAALLGEFWIGAAKQSKNVMLLTLGTGVGGATIVDGRMLRGHIGRAGHLGHVALDPNGQLDIANTPGSLEDAIGECTLGARSGGRFTTTRDLVAAVRKGDEKAGEIWHRSVRSLAAAIAGLINVLDPELVVLGGGIAEAGDALFGPLQAELDRFEWRPAGAGVRLAKAMLGAEAGAAGAAYGAKMMSEDNDAL